MSGNEQQEGLEAFGAASSSSDEQSQASAEENTATGGKKGGASSQEGNIVRHEPTGVEEWQASHDGYVTIAITITEKKTLTDHTIKFGASTETKHPEGTDPVRFHRKFGEVGLSFDTLPEWILHKYIETLSTPYHPLARPVSKEQIRIFVPDRLKTLDEEKYREIQDLQEYLTGLDEHDPPDSYINKLERYREIKPKTRANGEYSTQVKQIERTIRSRFGFTGRYSHEVPEEHADYADKSEEELKRLLEDARDQLAEAEDLVDELRDEFANYEDEWKEDALAAAPDRFCP